MRKMPVILFGFLIATLISMSTISPAQAIIKEFTWQPPYAYRGYDSWFYDDWVVGYEDGTTVNLQILVEGGSSPNINVTSIDLVFDTGLNKTWDYTAAPVKIDYDKMHTFDVSFTAKVNELSNLWPHEYTIYVKYNATWGTGTYYAYYYWDYEFVVYSADQVDIMELETEYDAIETDWYYFESAEAQSLAKQAAIEGSLGYTYLDRWDFANAKTHFQTSVDLFDDAYAAEEEWGTTYQQAMLNVTKIEAEAAMKEADAAVTSADAAMNQSYAWILFGLGFILIGIGVIIYAVKKPTAAKAA